MTEPCKWEVSAIRIETERLILRPISLEDAVALHEIFGDAETAELAGFPVSASQECSTEMVQRLESRKDTLVLVEKAENHVIGFLSLRNRQLHHEAVTDRKTGLEIGFVISRSRWGKRFAGEALQVVCQFCFRDLGCDYVYCRRFARNIRCERMLNNCGFIHLPDTAAERHGADREALCCHIRYREENEKCLN